MTGPREEPLKILVVEDEQAIRAGLCDVLAYHGYEPHGVERGDDGLAEAKRGGWALVILDVMLPGMNGFDVCRALRAEQPRLPVLILTARGAEEDVLTGFRAGSDDYMSKPFSIAELVARVEALLRRSGALDAEETVDENAAFAFGAWQIDPQRRTAIQGDETHDLTPKEVAILALLASEPGRIVSRRRLLTDVWGYESPERLETRTVDMHIAKLRKKLASGDEAPIETVRGEGYRYPG